MYAGFKLGYLGAERCFAVPTIRPVSKVSYHELSRYPIIQAYSSQIQAIHQIKHQLRNSSPRLPVDRVTFFASASIIMLACGAVAPLGLKDCRRKSNCTQLLPDLRWSSGPAFQIFQTSWQGPAGNYQKSLAAGQGNLVLQSTIAMFLRQRNS